MDDKGNTPLHWSAANGHNEVVTLLLDNGAILDCTGAHQKTPLHYAVMRGHTAAVATLLDRGASITATAKVYQQTGYWRRELNAIDLAIEYCPELIPLLLLKAITLDAVQQQSCFELIEGNNSNVLLYAAKNHPLLLDDLVAEFKKQSPDAIQLILDATNQSGKTPLMLAAKIGRNNAVRDLLELGADITTRDLRGDNALDIAREQQNSKSIELLLLKAYTLLPEQQKLCLSQIENGAYDSVLVYAMCEHPEAVNGLLLSNGRLEQCLAGQQAMDDFFDIDEHIDTFSKKLKEMEPKVSKNYRYVQAVQSTKTLIRDLKIAKAEFILNQEMSLENKKAVFKQRCLDAAEDARPVLKNHRELGKLIASLTLIILTLPISLPLLALGIFSLKTNSAQKLASFKEDVDYLSTSDNLNTMGQG
ncbi:hypothetical protein TUM19329_09020 [Legionella antarctica]|uniref:Uncharacterized protein n=1 Tax=Legionella antarctica TaxID=2708020 RepID=A0A6F8T250_9GAMM|nr:ankyrin repeat domain-containing protein [Legionella antarctica]BCA94541.1 hypothetical protein TUM19329_09020 [Legionella antarctica]